MTVQVFTREIAKQIASQVSNVDEFIEKLEEMKIIKGPRRNRMTKFDVVRILSQDDRERAERNSLYTLEQLRAKGLLVREPDTSVQGPGRKPYIYKVSGKGRGYLALSKKWKTNETA